MKYNTLDSKYHRAYKPDAQGFDEIKLVTVPRYKQSGLSGDEWRISIEIQFYRNGKLVHSDRCGGDMEKAVSFVAYKYAEACDSGHAHFAGEDEMCDQEGCAEKATVAYKKIHNYCREGHKTDPSFTEIRMFCDKHRKRGDCGLDDADRNYVDVTNELLS